MGSSKKNQAEPLLKTRNILMSLELDVSLHFLVYFHLGLSLYFLETAVKINCTSECRLLGFLIIY